MEVKIDVGVEIDMVNEQGWLNPEEEREDKHEGKNPAEFDVERGKVDVEPEKGGKSMASNRKDPKKETTIHSMTKP
jgi:hypothetical protein